jgi:hypothetical protein
MGWGRTGSVGVIKCLESYNPMLHKVQRWRPLLKQLNTTTRSLYTVHLHNNQMRVFELLPNLLLAGLHPLRLEWFRTVRTAARASRPARPCEVCCIRETIDVPRQAHCHVLCIRCTTDIGNNKPNHKQATQKVSPYFHSMFYVCRNMIRPKGRKNSSRQK